MHFIYVVVPIYALIFALSDSSSIPQCSVPSDDDRLDCFPQEGANQVGCLSRGCCWRPHIEHGESLLEESVSVPYCYYPTDYPNYHIQSLSRNGQGLTANLTKGKSTYLDNEILTLSLEVVIETNSRVRVRITDPNAQRYEVPIKLGPRDSTPSTNSELNIIIPSSGPFSLEIQRKSDAVSIFKSFGPLLYSNQFIQISSLMPTNQAYGIGEQNRPLLHQLSNGWSRIGLWARDNPVDVNFNLYGTHPFYMGMPRNGKAFGVYYFNSNAQEFVLQPTPAITYRTIGGVLDMFFFAGGSPELTITQYLELIGKPALPPYWSLGFHLSRYGYQSVNDIASTLRRNLDIEMPVEVQWSDIDYMDKYKDFTVDKNKFSDLGTYVTSIREKSGVKFVAILDPAIRIGSKGEYPTYDEGLAMDVYVKDSRDHQPLVGKVWPGETVYPDFTHPNAISYWTKQIAQFHKNVPVDGLWIDMNEPANFYEGSKTGCPPNNSYDHPFFVPNIRDGSLISKTICSSALHYNNTLHYNLHNLYGYTEALATHSALMNIHPGRRTFILSRSTFSGSGKYTFHWTGDNVASWDQMAHSIRQVINFNMFGIPMTGADICGFLGDSSEELCIRWMQLGAFYPFMRNHNTNDAKNQDPATWSNEAQQIMRNAINVRYSLLPYFYTALVNSHLHGRTVMKPLSFEFPADPVTHLIDLQFMIESAILVNPVVQQGMETVIAYFPAGIWYDFYNGQIISSSRSGTWIELSAPIDKINVALRGGHIVAMSDPQKNTDVMRKNGLTLYCGMSDDNRAAGELFWDDGESIDSYSGNKYSHVIFKANINGLDIVPEVMSYHSMPSLLSVVITGLKRSGISEVTVNYIATKFSFNENLSLLQIKNLNTTLNKEIRIKWT